MCLSLSARRAWIEIWPVAILLISVKSLSARRAWIEIVQVSGVPSSVNMSLSARRAWIEIFLSMGLDGRFKVALRKESVDRNNSPHGQKYINRRVALRKESVDRNVGIQAN